MKALCSQGVASLPHWGAGPWQGAAQASAPPTRGYVPWFVALLGISGGESRSKAIDFYVLSWDIPRTPACNLIETAQRKSQQHTISMEDEMTWSMLLLAIVDGGMS